MSSVGSIGNFNKHNGMYEQPRKKCCDHWNVGAVTGAPVTQAKVVTPTASSTFTSGSHILHSSDIVRARSPIITALPKRSLRNRLKPPVGECLGSQKGRHYFSVSLVFSRRVWGLDVLEGQKVRHGRRGSHWVSSWEDKMGDNPSASVFSWERTGSCLCFQVQLSSGNTNWATLEGPWP